MALSGQRADSAAEVGRRSSSTSARRINVAVTPDMLSAIEMVMEREPVTLTEAVRRLIGYGEVMYRAVKHDRQTVVFRSADGKEREVLLV